MPDLPKILSRTDLPTVNLPRVNAAAMGAPFEALSQAAGQWEHALRERKAPVDAALQTSEYNIKAEDLKNEVQANPDASQWTTDWRTKEAQMRAEHLANITDPRVKAFVNLSANRALDNHVKDLNDKALIATQARMKADVKVAGTELARQAAETTNEDLRKQYVDTFQGLVKTAEAPTRIGNKTFAPAWNKGEGDEARQKFEQEFLSHTADGEIERDPPKFLQNLKAGKYNVLDSDKRRQMEGHANAAITNGNSAYKRTQAEKEEAAGREIQMMVDKRVSTDIIQAKLQEFTENKTMDSKTRNYWDDRLMRGEKADDPVQTANFEKIKADLTSRQYTNARIKQFRDETEQMRNNGRLGDKGAAQMGAILNTAEKALAAEARAVGGEARAIANFNRQGGAAGKMSPAQAFQAVQKANFPAEQAGHPTSKGHKEDVQEINDRVVLMGEDARTVANEVVERRKRTKDLEAKLKAAKIEAVKKDPTGKAAAILNDAAAMPKR